MKTFGNPKPTFRRNTRVANIKSQQKRILTNERRRLRNKSVKSSLHTAVRGFRAAVEAGDKEKAAELLESTSRDLSRQDLIGACCCLQRAPSRPARR